MFPFCNRGAADFTMMSFSIPTSPSSIYGKKWYGTEWFLDEPAPARTGGLAHGSNVGDPLYFKVAGVTYGSLPGRRAFVATAGGLTKPRASYIY